MSTLACNTRRLNVPKKDIDELFDQWDPDKSGQLEIKELQKQLRRGGEIELDAALQDGAQGKIETEAKNKTALRTDKLDPNNSNLLQGLDLDETGRPYNEQLRDALSRNAVRSRSNLGWSPLTTF